MESGESTEGGNWGNEDESSDLSYSQEAMDNALGAADNEMVDHNTEYGYADMGMDAQQIGNSMQQYTGGFPGAAETIAGRNQINDFKDKGLFGQLGAAITAGKVGQDRGFMGQALGEEMVESGLNKMSSLASGGLLGRIGVKPGTIGINMANNEAIAQSLGLMGKVTGGQSQAQGRELAGATPGAVEGEGTDGLLKRLMIENRRRT